MRRDSLHDALEHGVGPGEGERNDEPVDPHPDSDDDFDEDVAGRESVEAVLEDRSDQDPRG